MSNIPNAQNYGQIISTIGEKPCEGARLVKVPFRIDGIDLQDSGGNPTPFTFSIDLSTVTEGAPSPFMSGIQGMIFNNPYGHDALSPGAQITPLLYNFKFSNGFECDIVSGGLIYMPLPATPPASVIITATPPSTILPTSDNYWNNILYFSNFIINPGTIGVITIGS